MSDSFDIAELGATLSLETSGELVLSRHGYSVALPSPLVSNLTGQDPLGRHLIYGVFFGVRLAIDRLACDFDPADERPQKPAQVYHHHEIPSVYGDRLPRLVPDLAIRWFAALTGEQPVTTDWIIDGLSFVYILETGKHLHMLAESDIEQTELTRDKIIRDARHALFYDSYKLKPRDEKRTEAGRVRIFRTVDGVNAGRVMLLPDFDYDAAREHGCFSMPSRDTMVIGRPSAKEFSDEIFERVSQQTDELLASEAFPMCSHVHRMTTDGVERGEFVGDWRLPPLADVTEPVEPPECVTIDKKIGHNR